MLKSDLKGEPPITTEHVKNNKDIRALLAKSGIKPEELPHERDIKELEKLLKPTKKFKIDAMGIELKASGPTIGNISMPTEDV